MSVKLYVEGGGSSDTLHRECREGFRRFLEKAGLARRMPRIVACGPRQAAYDRFKTACQAGERAVLLVDSEMPVTAASPWTHLANREVDDMPKPESALDEQCHLMVVVMEAWFLADKKAMADFFGQGFNVNALPQRRDIELVAKEDVYSGIHNATARCKTKAPYGKGEHSFKVLKVIAPEKVCEVSPWAKRFVDTLATIMGE